MSGIRLLDTHFLFPPPVTPLRVTYYNSCAHLFDRKKTTSEISCHQASSPFSPGYFLLRNVFSRCDSCLPHLESHRPLGGGERVRHSLLFLSVLHTWPPLSHSFTRLGGHEGYDGIPQPVCLPPPPSRFVMVLVQTVLNTAENWLQDIKQSI